MILDAMLASIILCCFGDNGLKALFAFVLIILIRTCHNVNWICGSLEQQVISEEDKEGEDE